MPDKVESRRGRILSNDPLFWRPDPSVVVPDGGPSGLRLAPYERDERLLWSVEQALAELLGPDGWARLRDALPSPLQPGELRSFADGVLVGAARTARDMVRDQIKGLAELIGSVIEFYSLVFDIELWMEILSVWTAEPGTGIDPFVDFLRKERPELLETMITLRDIERSLESAIAPFLEAAERGADDVLSLAGKKVADMLVAVPAMVGALLREKVEALVAAKGNPRQQGEIVGSTAASAIVTAFVSAGKLFDGARIGLALVRGIDDAAVRAMLVARAAAKGAEVARIEAIASESVTTLAKLGERASHRTAAMQAYEAVARQTGAHRDIKRLTGVFNRTVREEVGLSIHDTEYIKLRLDSHHYVEATWFEKFRSEWVSKLGISSVDDMRTVAIHTEFHIRSGANMAQYHGLLGAERERSLTTQIQRALAEVQEKTPFTKLRDVFEAHEQFYKSEVPLLWKIIADEFLVMKAKL